MKTSNPNLMDWRQTAGRGLVLVALLAIGSTNRQLIPDAWAGASQTAAPANPKIRITDVTPGLAHNRIPVVQGQPVQFCVSATDPNGYDESLQLSMSALPDGVSASFTSSTCAEPPATKLFVWNTQPGDATKFEDLLVVFKAVNTFKGFSPAPASARKIHIQVEDGSQPTLDDIATQTLTVGAPFNLPIAATADADNDPVSILLETGGGASALPKGAKLRKAKLETTGTNAGKWVANFKWKPTRLQFRTATQYKLSFLARDDTPSLPGADDPDQIQVTFNLVAPEITDDTIRSVGIGKAIWDGAGKSLSVSGKVKFTKPYAAVENLGVILTDTATQQPITSSPITVNDNGGWALTPPLVIDTTVTKVPCSVSATLVHVAENASTTPVPNLAAARTVKLAPSDCQ